MKPRYHYGRADRVPMWLKGGLPHWTRAREAVWGVRDKVVILGTTAPPLNNLTSFRIPTKI